MIFSGSFQIIYKPSKNLTISRFDNLSTLLYKKKPSSALQVLWVQLQPIPENNGERVRMQFNLLFLCVLMFWHLFGSALCIVNIDIWNIWTFGIFNFRILHLKLWTFWIVKFWIVYILNCGIWNFGILYLNLWTLTFIQVCPLHPQPSIRAWPVRSFLDELAELDWLILILILLSGTVEMLWLIL